MGAYEDLVRDTVEAVLELDKPLTLPEISAAVTPKLLPQAHRLEGPLLPVILLVLKSNPRRFAEVAPGTWVRRSGGRGEGPEAGVPSKPPLPLLAGGAAAAAIPPERLFSLDAAAREGAHVAVEEESERQGQPGGLSITARKLMEPLAKAIKRVAPSALNEA